MVTGLPVAWNVEHDLLHLRGLSHALKDDLRRTIDFLGGLLDSDGSAFTARGEEIPDV